MNKNKIDLGKYALKQLLRNPALIHQIQDRLSALPGKSILEISIRDGAKNNIATCIKEVISQYKDNPALMLEVVDMETMKLIEEFSGEQIISQGEFS